MAKLADVAAAQLSFGPDTPFTERERKALLFFWNRLEASGHADLGRFQAKCFQHMERIHSIRASLELYPRVFEEKRLGRRQRGLGTLVQLLANATDADFEMFMPTRALLWRSLTMAHLNFWRFVRYISEETAPEDAELSKIVSERVHTCVYLKLMDELLTSLSMDSSLPLDLRCTAVSSLTSMWDCTPTDNVKRFFPLLRAVWDARRNMMVSVGTMLGISEIMKLLQAGCAPEFVDYFVRASMSKDEGLAFQEFLIGVTTEQIHDLAEIMAQTGQTALTAAQADEALGRASGSSKKKREAQTGVGVLAYQFHRERHLEAAARRLRTLPGPKHTAEEYMLLYFLEEHLDDEVVH
ncbi:MAG: hypothetical protein O3A95_05945 [Planctomycetota bacterium]|nr:hypothetical protein [Planctomycetota bacterium]MDA1113824.1 hypothetical protein [Planctomycetota bacterium]